MPQPAGPRNLRRQVVRAVGRNGLLLAVLPLGVSLVLWSRLPVAFHPEDFWQDIPAWLGTAENALRLLVFAAPAFLGFGAASRGQRAGWWIYAAGVTAYTTSYLALIGWPASVWATSLVGFTAPAWTTTLWFVGIARVCEESWLTARWRWWWYLIPVTGFVTAHIAHTALVWSRVAGA
ncbi:MAG: hypothetical protein R3B06_20665 [Kofleriaceae bacterium]